MRSFYIDEASTDNNYGIYESLLLNEITAHSFVGIINDKEYYYEYNNKSYFTEGNYDKFSNYDFKFSIDKDHISILAKDQKKEISNFNMKVIMNMLSEVYYYNKEYNNKMYVFIPGNFFVDERFRYTNDIQALINDCQIKYDSMLSLQKTI